MNCNQQRVRELRAEMKTAVEELNRLATHVDARDPAGEMLYTLDECLDDDVVWAFVEASCREEYPMVTRTYWVDWSIEVEATSHLDAALRAEEYQRLQTTGRTQRGTFEVYPVGEELNRSLIDLSQPDEDEDIDPDW